ncbi:extracellular solute-binding protein [uncultured Oscillibacter sp.]|uniref:extracellular solute-binding protein n=1 Tax=uncultured Oscillibacter sp. TaxID=876091 RepID=UPI0025D55312|nr:extracellular solute-binding protein [uncultured Oscillibacter sp.]
MKKKLFALLMALVMVLSLAACGGDDAGSSADNGGQTAGDTGSTGGDTGSGGDAAPAESGLKLGYSLATNTSVYGPYWDEWSDMTDEELYELAKQEDTTINVYATSSKMLKAEEPFEEMYPELDLVVSDLDSDEVLSKAKIENETGNITADVLQTKDVNGEVFHEYYDNGVIEPFYPRDICEHISEENLKYSYPLYSSQAFWYYNTEAFPDGQPIHSWWEIIEKNDDGSQKYALYTKEIGQETAYLSLFASFINNADEMAQSYKDTYGKDLEYTYDASKFAFEVPENNAGVEYLWRFTQAEMTFIGDGDELVLAVHNSTADKPALALASAGKIENREESGYNIDWCINLSPYTALLNTESMFVVQGCNSPAGARLFIRYITGGADCQSGGLKPFTKVGNWPLRDDFVDEKNPAKLPELGARTNDLVAIYEIYPDVQDMWMYWLNQ